MTELTVYITQNADDQYYNNTGIFDNDWVYAGDYSSSYYDYTAVLRFLNVTIPQGATIDSAYLHVRAGAPTVAGYYYTKIIGHDADNSGAWSTSTDAAGRDRTTATVDWDENYWTDGEDYVSPDIKSIIQEIVDRGGWSSGNALSLFWADDQGVGYDAAMRCRAEALNKGDGHEPYLVINYTESSAVEITPEDADHAHSADEVEVTFDAGTVEITPEDADHSHSADEVAITVHQVITPEDADHSHSVDEVEVTVHSPAIAITPEDSSHDHTAEEVEVTFNQVVSPEDSSHAHSADEVEVTFDQVISPEDSTHAHSADEVTVTFNQEITPEDTLHAHTVDEVSIEFYPNEAVQPSSCTHAHSVDEVIFSIRGNYVSLETEVIAYPLLEVEVEPYPLLEVEVIAYPLLSVKVESR